MLTVLRLGHRLGRDARISTHVGLVARAFGADEIIYSGQKDEKMMNSVRRITEEFGGPFSVRYEKSWRKIIENFNGAKLHLTMYGKNHSEVKKEKNMLIIVGGEKVPGEVYELADYNVSVTNQPHSEVAALGVVLHDFDIKKDFKGAKKHIEGSNFRKIIK